MDTSSADTLLTVSKQLPDILAAITIIWSLVGFGLAGMGLVRLARSGNHRGSQSHGAAASVAMFVFGCLMLNLIGTMKAAVGTFYGVGASPEYVLSAVPSTGDQMKIWVAVLINIMVVLGWYFAGKGLFVLATHGGRQQGVGSGITRMVAAVALCNPQLFAYAIGASLGATSTVSLIIPPP